MLGDNNNKLLLPLTDYVTILPTMLSTSKRVKLSQTTWVLGDTNVRKYNLLWCDKQKQAKRNKPAKINGVQHHEISDAMVHAYYVPVQ